jgi:hypothetical protein
MAKHVTPPHVPSERPASITELRVELAVLLREGLPLIPSRAGQALMSLRSVWARAIDPKEPAARVDAADRLLRRLLPKIQRVGHRQLNDAARILFGLGAGAGLNLTDRRIAAANNSGYDYHHFRKHIEPKIIDHLAWLLHQDSLQYVPRGRRVPAAAPSGDTPAIEEEHIWDSERAAQEIALSRIWSSVYRLRAELILHEVRRLEQDEHAVESANQTARIALGDLLLDLDEYLERWGDRILHGEAEFNANSLIRLAGWTGELTAEQARELRWEAARRRSGARPMA